MSLVATDSNDTDVDSPEISTGPHFLSRHQGKPLMGHAASEQAFFLKGLIGNSAKHRDI